MFLFRQYASRVNFESCLCPSLKIQLFSIIQMNKLNSSKVSEKLLNNTVHITFRKLHLQIIWISSLISLLLLCYVLIKCCGVCQLQFLMVWFHVVTLQKLIFGIYVKWQNIWFLLSLSLNKIYAHFLVFCCIAVNKSEWPLTPYDSVNKYKLLVTFSMNTWFIWTYMYWRSPLAQNTKYYYTLSFHNPNEISLMLT